MVLPGEKYPATVNRIYYAMYWACLAVLTFETIIPSKHTAVIGLVNKKYVKENILPREIGRYLHKIQTARVEGDYKAKTFEEEEITELVKLGEPCLKQLEELMYTIMEKKSM